MKIAIAAKSGLTTYNEKSDDWLIKSELERQGVEVDIIDWRDKSVNLDQYDSIFVSSTWNMPYYFDEVYSWFEKCNASKKRLINDVELLQLSLNKDAYLTLLLNEFGDEDSLAGSITPSAFIKPLDKANSFNQKLSQLRAKNPIWSGDIVIKPIISADGYATYRFTDNEVLLKQDTVNYRPFNEAERIVGELLDKKGTKGIIIQPFIPYVELSGEYQLVFLGSAFSHATVKPRGFKNNTSDERKPIIEGELPPGMMDFANRVHQYYSLKYPHSITRMRIDFFAGQKGPILSEVELVEPNTNIRRLPSAQQSVVVEKYAKVLIKRTKELEIINLMEQYLTTIDTKRYHDMLKNSDVMKAVKRLFLAHQQVLSHLVASGSNKSSEARVVAPAYLKKCLDALQAFSLRKYLGKDLLITELEQAKKEYITSVLGKDRNDLSKVIRLTLMAVTNFIAALTFGIAHYVHYQKTGVALFFGTTASARFLQEKHYQLETDIKKSFGAD